jgi:ArsR family transcriptional regulator
MDSKLRDEVRVLHANVCKGLADPNRILLLYSLATNPCTVTELTELTELPQPTVSRHLRILRERGMVTAKRNGQSVFYDLADRRIIKALDLMRAVMADNLHSRGQLAESVRDVLTSQY